MKILRSLFGGGAVASDTSLQSEPKATIQHWQPTGRFEVQAVGTSYYSHDIASFARNDDGQAVLIYCTVTLKPEPDNQYDPYAVSAWIYGKKVGHLSREHNQLFLSKLPADKPYLITTCDAVVTGGSTFDGDVWNYGIRLDIQMDGVGSLAPIEPTYLLPLRTTPPKAPSYGKTKFIKRGDGEYLVTVVLPPIDPSNLDRHRRVQFWFTDRWTTINYYLMNDQNAGLGIKVFEIPKKQHRMMFGDAYPDVYIDSIDEPNWTFRMTLHATAEDYTAYLEKWKTPERRAFESHIAVVKQKSVIEVMFIAYEPSVAECQILLYKVSMPKGEPIKVIRRSEVKLSKLPEMIGTSDVVIAKDQTACVSALTNNMQSGTDLMLVKWRDLGRLWLEPNKPHYGDLQEVKSIKDTGLVQCRHIADFIFTRSGKTERSQTYLSVLVKMAPPK